MPASYPAAVKTFTTKNTGDVIQPADVNDLQDEVNAIEAGIRNGTAPVNSSGSTMTTLSVTGFSTLNSLIVTNSINVGSNLGFGLSFQIGTSTSITLSSGNTNDLAISALTVLRLTANSSGSTLTGLAFAGGAVDRQTMLLLNVSANPIVLAHQTGSASTGQFLCPNSAAVTVRANGSVWLYYDADPSIKQWRPVGL